MKINIENMEINYISEGQGKNILILHGWGASIETIMPIFNHLKNHFKVYAIDFPGCGMSQKPNEVLGAYDYGRITKAFIDAMKMEEVILIGHSHGGRVSLVLANKYPELVKKMVLIDSAGLIPKRKLNYYIKVYTFKALKKTYGTIFFWMDKEKKMEKFYKRFGSTDYKDADGIMRKILVRLVNEDLRPLLKGINASTLLIWGRDDDATPVYMGEIMKEEIKDSGLVILENAGHYSYLDQFSRFKAIIDSFLEKDKIS